MARILLLSYEYPPDVGGAGVVAADMARLLEGKGHTVSVVTRRNRRRDASGAGQIHQVPSVPKLYPLFFFLRAALLGLGSFTHVILNDIAGFLVGGFFFPQRLQAKCIIYCHGGELDEIFLRPSRLNRLLGFSRRMRRLMHRCRRIVFVSDFYRSKFLASITDQAVSEKSVVIHNCYDERVFYPEPQDLRKAYRLPASAALLLSTGRVAPGKGYETMLRIFARLNSDRYAYHWFIIGDGRLLPSLRKQADRLKVADKITVIRGVPRGVLRSYYSSVDLFWSLSAHESFGLVFVEAAACGTPSLARNCDGMRESIRQNASGILVDSDEECLATLRDRRYTRLSRDSILSFARSFRIREKGSDILNLFR